METARYRGDLTPTGDIAPFRVAAPEGLHPDAKRKLTDAGLEFLDEPARAQALIIRSKTNLLLPQAFTQFPDLMYVARAGVGVDNISMPHASEAGVATVNTPGASTHAVAQRVTAFILAWAARIREGTEALRDGRWPKGELNVEPLDTTEKTLGIVGLGRIGRATQRLAGPFFGKVIYYDRDTIGDTSPTPLKQLMEEADVVSVNISGKDQVLTREMLAHLKPGSLVVNTARGTVIDLDTLLERMHEGVSAALDVFPNEGKPDMFRTGTPENPEETVTAKIARHPRFLGTPHTAASDEVTQKKLGLEAAERIIEFAHKGTVNAGNSAGHTLPAITLEKPPSENGNGYHHEETPPRSRVVTLHRSVKGASKRLDEIIAAHDVNIAQSVNAEGPHKLAMSLHDIDEVSIDVLVQILAALDQDPDVLKRRIIMNQ
ncbi:MAG: NAD(P)-dependent oxidoreductase [Candidatus Peribacteraceae bacterium]|nr:NAD(P)-dependent oxidoreductase [Candidatus Peribacteraceae bacterium]